MKRNPQDATGWMLLEYAYQKLPRIRAALAILEDGLIKGRVEFLGGDSGQQEQYIAEIVRAGGLYDVQGRFVEVTVP